MLERERVRPFSEAWEGALAAVEDREARNVPRETQKARRDCCERRESKIAELA